MMEKTKGLEILENIETKLNYDDWKEAKKDVECYIKNLEITIDKEIKKLVVKYKKCVKKYGEDNIRTRMLTKKIDKKLKAIYNKE